MQGTDTKNAKKKTKKKKYFDFFAVASCSVYRVVSTDWQNATRLKVDRVWNCAVRDWDGNNGSGRKENWNEKIQSIFSILFTFIVCSNSSLNTSDKCASNNNKKQKTKTIDTTTLRPSNKKTAIFIYFFLIEHLWIFKEKSAEKNVPYAAYHHRQAHTQIALIWLFASIWWCIYLAIDRNRTCRTATRSLLHLHAMRVRTRAHAFTYVPYV